MYNKDDEIFKKNISINGDINLLEENISFIFDYVWIEKDDTFKTNLNFIFYEYFFRSAVSNKVWNKEKNKKTLSEIMSISDEALVYLIYENCRNVWIKMIQTGNRKKVDVKSKYTADRSGNILNNGWSREGLIRFNKYVKFVKDDRKKR